ncbi:MAG: DNA repair protein RecO [Clostridiales bacterium]|nr:DNA repair protein RecO [Clostridiales bacterium]
MGEITRHLPTQGVVLRYTNIKEADRMLTILTPALGKISVLARGCRKGKSKLLAATELFCYGDFVLYRKGNFHIMTQATVQDSFYDIRNDLDRLVYASYILDLTGEVANPGQEDNILFYLLLNTLSYMCYSDISPMVVTHFYEVKLMDHLGYRPILDRCIACGTNTNLAYFDIRRGGLLCNGCHKTDRVGYNIQMGTAKTLAYILDMDIKRLGVLRIPIYISQELDRIIGAYIEEQLDKKIKTRQFIKEFNRNSPKD